MDMAQIPHFMPGEELPAEAATHESIVQAAADAIITEVARRLTGEANLSAMAEEGRLVYNTVAQVEEFHDAYGVPKLTGPALPDSHRMTLRLALIAEEFDELRGVLGALTGADPAAPGALREGGAAAPSPGRALGLTAEESLTRIAKELCDLQYVLDGTFLEFGLAGLKSHLMNAVHASNMSKLGDDGRPVLRDDGKVLKGPNYEPAEPAIAELIAGALPGADAVED